MFSLNKSVSKLKSLSKRKSNEERIGNKIPNKVKLKKSRNGQKSQSKTGAKGLTKGVIMISNIAHGFYEKQMFDYFSQFGKVLRIRISKNRKTGKRRNYGFIEFECEEVAQIAANTMNNYLMFDQILKCQFIPKSKVKEKPNLFKNWNKQFVSSTQIHKSLHNRKKSIEREFKLMRNRLKKVRQMESHLKDKGLDFKCEVINLPNISNLRQEMKVESNVSDIKPKTSTKHKQNVTKTSKRKPEELVRIVKKSKPLKSGRKALKTAIFPKLHKFSIILLANNRKLSNSHKK